ncbi:MULTISPECIES: tripartite tricarboxylate transporter TctB family protein [Streptomyces]|uniref:tripartite tricarboxylate transporter TctB family protein n=1 Tax=Streptomyces TaxID=1883 RepID=UPI000A3A83EA|nr:MULTISPECIES: tripartite tricarboxylate transporter TctB family protein [Streptomyces]MDX3617867.1 tripartite tricarboxylate transporter TctB family protein [Streptomyces europaeiscabiei]MDX3636975.1 tripartite tricarboxylate transporter TctB family protein [Streptomyces europaeiscabiei]MDX3652801.1 tripartite tricarboxylate transporter TctB family protein [Streptomyces europaeiscabiei]
MGSPTEIPSAAGEPADENRPPAAGPATQLVTAVVVVALGATALTGALNLGVGSPAKPGPGTWPALVSAALTVLGVLLAANAQRMDDAEQFTRTGLLVLVAVGSMVAFVAVVGVVGFEIPAALLTFFWLRVLGRESWRTSIAVSLVLTIVLYALFVGALEVTIPHLF